MLELQDQPRLARGHRRARICGASSPATCTTRPTALFAGIPVSVAAATCYTLNLTAKDRLLSGVDFGQAINLVHVYDDQIVHSTVPIGDPMEVSGFPIEAWAAIEAMTPEERREAFSSKTSTFGQAEAASSS